MDFEQLRLIDLIKKFSSVIDEIYSTQNLKKIKQAGADLQSIYNFLLTSQNPYEEQAEDFKNLFSSFNYAAVIVNDAIKNGGLKSEDNALLGECMEIMTTLNRKLIKSLS